MPILWKIMRKIINNQLIEHLEKHDILYEYLSGFRSKHSVNTCLAPLSNKILKGFESGKTTEMILIDLKKAFDTLDHVILWFLLKKAKHCYKPRENSFGNRNFELWCPTRINFRPYTIFIIYKQHEDSTEELQPLALHRWYMYTL